MNSFQSHNGAIAARSGLDRLCQFRQFQSHNGAIAARRAGFHGTGKVRVSIPQWCDCCMNWRPSWIMLKIVSIPQWCDCCSFSYEVSASLRFKFQSHNGAIAARPYSPTFGHHAAVSIPQWCDCCPRHHDKRLCDFFVSIPQWCDCCLQLRFGTFSKS